MSLLSKLFGGASRSEDAAEPQTYNGFHIFPEPQQGQGGYRIAARIEKEIGGETKTHALIRADTCNSRDEAVRLTILKAKQVIDEQGDQIFS